MTLMAGMDLPLAAVREQIAGAINLIVQQARFSCGARRIVVIAEVTGTESGRVQMQDLFRFDRESAGTPSHSTGGFRACGNEPVFFETLAPGMRPAPIGRAVSC